MQPTSVAWRMARHVRSSSRCAPARTAASRCPTSVTDGEHPFVVQKAFETARDSDPDRLEAALRAIRDYEWEVKSDRSTLSWARLC